MTRKTVSQKIESTKIKKRISFENSSIFDEGQIDKPELSQSEQATKTTLSRDTSIGRNPLNNKTGQRAAPDRLQHAK